LQPKKHVENVGTPNNPRPGARAPFVFTCTATNNRQEKQRRSYQFTITISKKEEEFTITISKKEEEEEVAISKKKK
jgi:hypothetical protein